MDFETSDCTKCDAVFRTPSELDAHMRSHGTGKPTKGMSLSMRDQMRQVDEANKRLAGQVYDLERQLEVVRNDYYQAKATNDRLVWERSEEAKARRQAKEEADARQVALETVAAFSDDDLEQLGITRAEALERALPTPVETEDDLGPPKSVWSEMGVDLDGQVDWVRKQQMAMWDRANLRQAGLKEIAELAGKIDERERKDLLNSVINTNPDRTGPKRYSAGTHDSGHAMDLSVDGKKMRGQRVQQLTIDEGLPMPKVGDRINLRVGKGPSGEDVVTVDPQSYRLLQDNPGALHELYSQINQRKK